jgi:hypothetical protein
MQVTGPNQTRPIDRTEAAVAPAPAKAAAPAAEHTPRAAPPDVVDGSRARAAAAEGSTRDRVTAQQEAPAGRPKRGLNSMEGDVCKPTDLLDRGEMNGVAPTEINNKKGSNKGMVRGGGGVRRTNADEDCTIKPRTQFDV